MKPIKPIQNKNSGLLRWTHQEARYSITWGTWNNSTDRAKLEVAGRMIYEDLLIDAFDETLVRYKSWLNGAPQMGPRQAVKKKPSLVSLLEDRLDENYNGADLAILKLLGKYGKAIDTPDKAKDFVKWVRKRGVASTSLKRYLNTLRSIRKDLFADIKVKIEEKPKPAPFNRKEIDRILQTFRDQEEFSHYYPFVVFLLNTGCRISEAIGIQWQNIDLEKREIHVFESLARGRSKSERVRKTTKSCRYRIIPLNEKLLRVLSQMGRKDELVFLSMEGKPINDSNLCQRIWRSALKAAGVKYRPISKTRSTFASHCAESGLAPHVIAQLLGHSRTSTTFDFYLGVIQRPILPEL